MAGYDERLAALEQSMLPRIDFINAINKLSLQQAQSANDVYHEVTILLGVVGSQGQDIKTLKGDVSVLKEDVSALKGDVSVLKGDVSALKGDVSVLKGDVSVLKEDMHTVKGVLDSHTELLTQILARLPEKAS